MQSPRQTSGYHAYPSLLVENADQKVLFKQVYVGQSPIQPFDTEVWVDSFPNIIIDTTYAHLLTMYEAKQVSSFRSPLRMMLSEFEENRDERMKNLRARVLSLPEWQLFDFVYLSTVTITTLGFGDIVPNSSFSRLIVVVQCFVGAVLLAFAVSFLARDTP